MIFIIGFVIAMLLVILVSEEERLGEDNERAWINYLADVSRRRKATLKPGRACRYSRSVWIPGK